MASGYRLIVKCCPHGLLRQRMLANLIHGGSRDSSSRHATMAATEPRQDDRADSNRPGDVLGKITNRGQRVGDDDAEDQATEKRNELGDQRDADYGQNTDGDGDIGTAPDSKAFTQKTPDDSRDSGK